MTMTTNYGKLGERRSDSYAFIITCITLDYYVHTSGKVLTQAQDFKLQQSSHYKNTSTSSVHLFHSEIQKETTTKTAVTRLAKVFKISLYITGSESSYFNC